MLADLMTVSLPVQQRAQDEHVECALQKFRPLWFLLCHGRRSTRDDK
jgi:hypothetical protein